MQITLTTEAQEALRRELARSPGRQPEEIVEQALTELSQRADPASQIKPGTTHKDFRAWLAELRQGARPVPHVENETFSREMIYQDHD